MEYVNTHGVSIEFGDAVEVVGWNRLQGLVLRVDPLRMEARVRVSGSGEVVSVSGSRLSLISKMVANTPAATSQIDPTPTTVSQPTLFLLLAGKIDAEDVTILGFYNKPPGQYSLGDLGLKPGGSRYGALARAFGVTVEELQKFEVRGGIGGDMKPTFLWAPSESTPSTGWVRIVPVVDGMAYTVSNAYNF